MKELKFESSLTMEQIEENFANTDVFANLLTGLEEALAIEKGNTVAQAIIRTRSEPSS